MTEDHTSIQQLRVAQRRRRRMPALPSGLGEESMEGAGHAYDWGVSGPPIVNETKLHIIAVMGELARPVTAAGLHTLWGGRKPLSVFDYHLCTLVKAGVAEVVLGPELRFRLTDEVRAQPVKRLSGSGAVSADEQKCIES